MDGRVARAPRAADAARAAEVASRGELLEHAIDQFARQIKQLDRAGARAAGWAVDLATGWAAADRLHPGMLASGHFWRSAQLAIRDATPLCHVESPPP